LKIQSAMQPNNIKQTISSIVFVKSIFTTNCQGHAQMVHRLQQNSDLSSTGFELQAFQKQRGKRTLLKWQLRNSLGNFKSE